MGTIDEMDKGTNVSPKLTDLIPLYGGINYIGRTTYDIREKPSIGNLVMRGVLTLAQIAYNSYIGAEAFNLLEGKPTLTSKILEKII